MKKEHSPSVGSGRDLKSSQKGRVIFDFLSELEIVLAYKVHLVVNLERFNHAGAKVISNVQVARNDKKYFWHSHSTSPVAWLVRIPLVSASELLTAFMIASWISASRFSAPITPSNWVWFAV